MKQTAIQEMINEFTKELNVATQIGNEDKIRITKHLINIASKYLEMEKEQISKAYEQGSEDGYWHPENGYSNEFESAEQYYYNETFKSECILKFILNKLGLNKPKLGTFKKFGEDYPKPKCSYCGKEARWLKSAGIHVNTCNNCQDKLSCLD